MEKKIYLFLGNVIYRLLLSNFACTPSNEHASLICMRSFKRIILNKPSDFCPVTIRVLVLVFKLIRSRSFEKPGSTMLNDIWLFSSSSSHLLSGKNCWFGWVTDLRFGVTIWLDIEKNLSGICWKVKIWGEGMDKMENSVLEIASIHHQRMN